MTSLLGTKTPNIKMHATGSYNSKERRGKHYLFNTEENCFFTKRESWIDREVYFLILKDKTSSHLPSHKNKTKRNKIKVI